MQKVTYGSRALGERLLRARIANSFGSAAEAAAHHGWNQNSYASVERGQRPMTKARAEAFSIAYGVPSTWLLDERASLMDAEGFLDHAKRQLLESGDIQVIRGMVRGRQRLHPAPQHERLRAARQLAGMATISEAADVLGIARATYNAHEIGARKLSPQYVLLYGAAFGVERAWLEEGRGPSGLPISRLWPEERWSGVLDDLTDAPSADRSRIGSSDVLRDARRVVQVKAACRSQDKFGPIPQIRATEDGDVAAVGEWTIPEFALAGYDCDDDCALVAVEVDVVGRGISLSKGDYILVDISPGRGQFMGWSVAGIDGAIAVRKLPDRGSSIRSFGSVKARLLGRPK